MATTLSSPNRPRLCAVADTTTTAHEVAAMRWARPSPQVADCAVPAPDEVPDSYPHRDYWLRFAQLWVAGHITGLVLVPAAQVGVDTVAAHLTALRRADLDPNQRLVTIAWLASLWLSAWDLIETQ